MAIVALHTLLYAKKAAEVRAFFKDTLGLPSVDGGSGDWPIFKAPPAEIAVHPIDEGDEFHELYLVCDDVHATIAELKAKGVKASPVSEQPWGLLTTLTLPGGTEIGMYQPKHATAYGLKR